MKFYGYLAGIMLLSSKGLQAQNVINTDRPDQSEGTHIIEKEHFQIETGGQFSRSDEFTNNFDYVTLIRYGVSRVFEIRLLNQYSIVCDSNKTSGFRSPAISFKNQLCKQNGWLPKLTLVSYLHLPLTISNVFRADHFGYSVILAGRHDLTPGIKLYSNIGVTQDQESTDISYSGAFEINYTITGKLSGYAEYFGNYAAHTYAANGLDIGLIYAVKNNLAVDLALGSPTLQLHLARFISAGLSIRLPN